MIESTKRKLLREHGAALQRVADEIRRIRGLERTRSQVLEAFAAECPARATSRMMGFALDGLLKDPQDVAGFAERIREPEIEDGVGEALGED